MFASLFLSAIVLAVAVLLFELLRENGTIQKATLPLCVAVLGGYVAASIAALQAFLLCPLLLVIGWICLAANTRTATFAKWSLGAVLLVPLWLGGLEIRKWANVRRTYPLESLAERLSYKLDRAKLVEPGRTPPDGRLEQQSSIASLIPLEEEIQRFSNPGRATTLAYAHASQVQQFIDSQGLGVARMRGPNPYHLRPSRGQGDRLAGIRAESPPSSSSAEKNQESPPITTQRRSALDLEPLHISSIVDFVNPAGFGWVKDIDQVAGFEPHAFSKLPLLMPASGEANERWLTTRVELVSLLKHDEPMVYVSSQLPKMDELTTAPVRPLDVFEVQSLAKLREGEPLAIEATDNRIRMLGPILALQQCQLCHTAERGEMLGAFSYEFLRDPPAAFEAQADGPPQPEL